MSEFTLAFGVLFLAGSLGCEGPGRDPPLDPATINAGLDPGNHRIVSLVTYFGTHGIQLVHERGGWWHVTEPANPGYDVIVSLRAFPESATADQMQNALRQINLAYLLNAPAHVAMSYPSLRGAGPGATKEPRFVRLKATLERLLQEYRPPARRQHAGLDVTIPLRLQYLLRHSTPTGLCRHALPPHSPHPAA